MTPDQRDQGRDPYAEDPALKGNFSDIWAGHIRANDAKPLPETGRWKPSEHTKLVKQTMDAMERLPGRRRIRKRQTGRFIATDAAGNPRKQNGKWVYVKVSVAGDPDVEISWQPPGWARPLMIACECKTGTGRLSEEQKEKRDDLTAMGWIFLEVRDAAQAFRDVLALGARGETGIEAALRGRG